MARVTLVYPARRACRPRSRVPLSRPRRAVRATASVPGQDAFDQARIKINRCSKSWRAGADVDRHRSARRAPPGRVRRGEGDAGRQDASTPTAWQAALLAMARPRAGARTARQVRAGRPDRGPGRRSRAAWRARYAGLPGAARVPAQVARTLIQASQAQYAPRHLFLGRDAFDQARIKIQSVQELARWREMSIAIGPLDERRLAA